MKIVPTAIAVAALSCASSAAVAEPIQIYDDETYSRLARWEQHLDDRISQGVRSGSLRPTDAWRFQKRLDSIEIHLVQDTLQSNNGLDEGTASRYADQLRRLGMDLGERGGWSGYYGGGPGGYGGGNGGGYGGGYSGGGQNYGPPPPPPPGANYYREGDYESQCHRGNAAAGTIFGAIAGGLIGGAASHGNGGAVVGGVVLGGLVGNALSRDIDCDDQRYAFARYDEALDGPVGSDARWDHNGNYGTIRVVDEYRDGPYTCRHFHTVNYRHGQRFERDGTACHENDGYWHFR
jgi:surface antigen